uniref:Uncharacterized protein n=1 Tax=Glossina austeni TaxID=7395 RepID=A0A1A9V108_GLOAU
MMIDIIFDLFPLFAFKLVHYSIGLASFKGDHYASIMFRCKVLYKLIVNQLTKHKSMILKTVLLKDCAKRELLMASNLFETEISMHTKALPKVKEILGVYCESSKLYAEMVALIFINNTHNCILQRCYSIGLPEDKYQPSIEVTAGTIRHFSFLPIFEAAMCKSVEYMKTLEVSDVMEAPEKLVDNYYATNFVEILRQLLLQLLREGYLD